MSCSTSSTADDTPALAGAIVEHAGSVCEHTDHLRHVLGDVSIPVDGLTDHRQQHKVSYGTEPMARLYIYQQIHDLSQSEVVDRLKNRPSVLKTLGLDDVPDQQVISYAWQQFSRQTEQILVASATGIALEARDNGVILEQRLPILPEDCDIEQDEDGEPQVTRDLVRERGGNLVKVARRHGFGEFDSNRASNRTYEDEQILDLFSNACLTQGSAHSEGETGWFLDENEICDDSTFLRVIKRLY